MLELFSKIHEIHCVFRDHILLHLAIILFSQVFENDSTKEIFISYLHVIAYTCTLMEISTFMSSQHRKKRKNLTANNS